MKLVKKLCLLILLLTVVVGGVGYLAIANIDALVARYREPIERWVSDQLGGRVGSTKIEVKLLPRPRVELEGVELRLEGEEPAFTATRISIDFELAPLLWRTLTLNSVAIDDPEVRLERNAAGISLLGAAPKPTANSAGPGLFIGLDRFEVRRGRLSIAERSTGVTHVIEGIDIAGGLRFEDGELRIAPLSIRGAKLPRLGDFSGEFGEVRSSLKNDRGSAVLNEGGFGAVRFSGDGEWRISEGSARVRLNGAKTGLGDLVTLIERASGRSMSDRFSAFKYTGAVEPKFTVELGGDGGFRVNGAVGFDGASLHYRDVVVEQIRGMAKVALTDKDGKIALESFRGTVGPTRASISLEGIVETAPFGGELRVSAAALPLTELRRFLPDSEGYGIVVTNGSLGGKFTYRLDGASPWNFVGDVRDGAGTLRGVPFQDGVGKFRVVGGRSTPDIFLEQLTVGLNGGAEAIVVKGELRESRGSGSVSSSKLSAPTALALLGVDTTAWSEIAGELRLDLKGRYDGVLTTVQGPIGVSGGAGRRGDYAISGVAGELDLQFGAERKLIAREVRFDLNGEPFVWRGNVVAVSNGVRFERTSLGGFGGDLAFDGVVSFEEPRRFEMTGRGRGISIEPVRKFFGIDSEGGALTGELTDLRWRISGVVGEGFARTAQGGVAFRLERGALRGVNIGRVAVEKLGSIPLVRDLLVGAIPAQYRPYFDAPDTPIHSLAAEIDLAGGRASSEALRLESDLFGLDGRGAYEFGGGVDLGATLWLERRFAQVLAERVRELRSLFGPEGTIVMPLRITGAPTELSVSPDIGALVARAARGVVEREAERFIDRAIDRLTDGGEGPYDGQYDDGQ